ncbi:MAG: hypothetical protein OEU26_21580 [Candidatus Tectomicrobia bacterium]|nr:hypothetical protein [Candidatus Tectomicrobia bacterium]
MDEPVRNILEIMQERIVMRSTYFGGQALKNQACYELILPWCRWGIPLLWKTGFGIMA